MITLPVVGMSMCLVATLLAVLAPRRLASAYAVGGSLLVVLLVHIEFDAQLYAVAVASLVVLNMVAWLRMGSPRTLTLPQFAFLGWMGISPALHATGPGDLVRGVALAALLVLFAANTVALRSELVAVLRVVTGIVLPLEALLATLERFAGMNAIWPRRGGMVFRADGVNNLWNDAGGRALGTMGWAITLGEVTAILTVLATWFFFTTRRVFWLGSAVLGIYVIALSGTRTAIIMLIAAGTCAVFLTAWRRIVSFGVGMIGITVLLLLYAPELPAMLGFGERSAGSSSVLHRQAVLDSAGNLILRNPLEAIFGSGYSSVPDLFTQGVLVGSGGTVVVDNEYVRSLAALGIIGIGLLVLVAVGALVRGPTVTRVLVVTVLVGATSYDIFSWSSLLLLSVVVLSMDLRSTEVTSGSAVIGAMAATTNRAVSGALLPEHKRLLRE